MPKDQSAQNLGNFYQRLDALLQRDILNSANDTDLSQARQELLTFVEELRVALDELQERNTELQAARARIEAERRRYRDLFEFAPDGYLITDQHGAILEANQTAADMLGVPASYLTRKPLASYIHTNDRQDFRMRLAKSIQIYEKSGERVERWELRIQPRKLPPFYALFIVAISRRQGRSRKQAAESHGDEIVVRWMIQDVNEQHQAREVLQQAQEALEKRVLERTEELTVANDELRQLAKELEARNRELQEFAFVASHDLQEPLRKVRAFAERLIERSQDPDAADYLERMRNAAMRMQTMLDGLLEYARVSSQARPFEPTDLSRVAREVLSDLELRVHQAGASVEIEPLPTVTADQLQMYRLFQNLISNAIKFHRPDLAPEVKISGEILSGSVVLRFADNGIGFNMQHLDRLFKPFSRLQGRSKFDGSGMGLAICRKILERHGGQITAESTPNEGSTFIVTLPCQECDGTTP